MFTWLRPLIADHAWSLQLDIALVGWWIDLVVRRGHLQSVVGSKVGSIVSVESRRSQYLYDFLHDIVFDTADCIIILS